MTVECSARLSGAVVAVYHTSLQCINLFDTIILSWLTDCYVLSECPQWWVVWRAWCAHIYTGKRTCIKPIHVHAHKRAPAQMNCTCILSGGRSLLPFIGKNAVKVIHFTSMDASVMFFGMHCHIVYSTCSD